MYVKAITTFAVLFLISCVHAPEQAEREKDEQTVTGTFYESPTHAPVKPDEVVPDDRQPPGNIYERLRRRMRLDHQEHRPAVKHLRQWYANKQEGEYMRRALQRGSRYLHHILEKLEKRNLPGELALLPLVESAFQPYARSHKHAAGLWQFIPSTGRRYGLKQNDWYDGRYDPVDATEAALNYLQDLHEEFDGDWQLALAGYNWGEKSVRRSMRRNKARGKAMDFWSIRKPRETANYVASLLAVASLLKNPSYDGLRIDPIPDQPYFTIVSLAHPIDMGLAAELSGVDIEELYKLNAGYKDWLVSKDSGNGRLSIPVNKAPAFVERLEKRDHNEWLEWETIRSVDNESVASLAALYGVSPHWLSRINGLPATGSLKKGTRIRIPKPMYADKHYASRRPIGGWAQIRRDGTRHWHMVRRGESIWSISRRYATSVKQIKRWNPKLARQRFLQPGQEVAVWLPKQHLHPDREDQPGEGTHTVRAGESLWLIARRYGTSVRDLARWNELAANTTLRIGQSLRIGTATEPRSSDTPNEDWIRYTVRKGDSLWSIAQRYRVTIKKLLAWNNFNRPPRFLRPGQRLTIRR